MAIQIPDGSSQLLPFLPTQKKLCDLLALSFILHCHQHFLLLCLLLVLIIDWVEFVFGLLKLVVWFCVLCANIPGAFLFKQEGAPAVAYVVRWDGVR